MTELKSADEWAREDWPDEGTGGCVELHNTMRAKLADRYRACQHNAALHYLEAAANAECKGCDEGWPFRDSMRVIHAPPSPDPWPYRCRARGIRKLHEQLNPAPTAGKDDHE